MHELEDRFECDSVRMAIQREAFVIDAANDPVLIDRKNINSVLPSSFNSEKLTTQLQQLKDFLKMTNETKTDDVHSISNAFNWKDSMQEGLSSEVRRLLSLCLS